MPDPCNLDERSMSWLSTNAICNAIRSAGNVANIRVRKFWNHPAAIRESRHAFSRLDEFQPKRARRIWFITCDFGDDLPQVNQGTRRPDYFVNHESNWRLTSSWGMPSPR